MYRLCIAAALALAVCGGCAGVNPMKLQPTVLGNVDFDYNSTWQAAMGAVQIYFPYLEYCNKDDMRIVSYYKPETDTDITMPREYARRAFLTIKPREASGGTSYDIEIRVGKYWRPRDPMRDISDNWELIRWDRDIEQKIKQEFMNQTILEQRRLQGHEKFNKHRSRGW